LAASPAAAFSGFTGNVPADFSPGEYVPDPGGFDVGVPQVILNAGYFTGNELLGIALHYDPSIDNGTLFVGFHSLGVGGDVDGDGLPNHTSIALLNLGGFDFPHETVAESFTFCLEIPGYGGSGYDLIAGIPRTNPAFGWDDFAVEKFIGSPYVTPFAFGGPFSEGVTGELYNYGGDGEPSTARPHIEFAIHGLQFLGVDEVEDFGQFQAFIGSYADAGIGEDFIIGSVPTPEPGQIIMIGSGLVILAGIARRRLAAKKKPA
jgi:hypothetical protein